MKLVGANPAPAITGHDALGGTSNYLIGNDPTRWITGVPHYGRVQYKQVYQGIDLVYYGNQRELEYDFIVQPGADPGVIALSFEGCDQAEIDERGDLLLHTAVGLVRQRRPVIYQEVAGTRIEVEGRYKLLNAPTAAGCREPVIGFELGSYDATQPLVIDPTLVYASYLGSTEYDEGNDVAVDSNGNAYIVGATASATFPRANPLQPNYGGGSTDLYVIKLNPAGNRLVYSTFIGGVSGDDGNGVTVDAEGNVYVTGATASPDFPVVGPAQRALNGGIDAFVLKLNPDGNRLLFSTYLGGSRDDNGLNIAIDSARNVYVTGNTLSVDFPTVNPIQRLFQGGQRLPFGGDAFVTKLSATGSSLVYSTYLGGSSEETGLDIAVNAAGEAYVVGDTYSSDFPTANPLQASNAGEQDAFVAKLTAAGSAFVFSTYLGGNRFDRGLAIALDDQGSAYVAGFTNSPNWVTTPRPFQETLRGPQDAYVVKLNASGTTRLYSTYLGGSQSDQALGIAVDRNRFAYVTGSTISNDFPRARDLQRTLEGDRDAFISKLAEDGRELLYSTYFGGGGFDQGFAIAVDRAGSVYITGVTNSLTFPQTNPVQNNFGGGTSDAFIAKVSDP
ncbi:MAG: SBBP repeat-containing protein [Acidobacteriota bacterium]|nr:SBBP repeat-containing protein [Blastocatellia bacterium]MDW8238049.1 SBBP repeat-containing protein [Acidobacteriota bacterium]